MNLKIINLWDMKNGGIILINKGMSEISISVMGKIKPSKPTIKREKKERMITFVMEGRSLQGCITNGSEVLSY